MLKQKSESKQQSAGESLASNTVGHMDLILYIKHETEKYLEQL